MKSSIFSSLFPIFFCIFIMLHNSSCNRANSRKTSPAAQTGAQPVPALVRPAKAPETPTRPFDPFPARREDVVDTIHGHSVRDPYRWMEDSSRPDVQKWLAQQDAYTRQFLSKLPGRDAMARRLSELSYVDWVGPPVRRGNRYFFPRRHADKEKIVYYWQEGIAGTPRVLLDPNTLSSDGSIAVKGVFPSLDGKTAAYLVSVNNADHATLRVVDVLDMGAQEFQPAEELPPPPLAIAAVTSLPLPSDPVTALSEVSATCTTGCCWNCIPARALLDGGVTRSSFLAGPAVSNSVSDRMLM